MLVMTHINRLWGETDCTRKQYNRNRWTLELDWKLAKSNVYGHYLHSSNKTK